MSSANCTWRSNSACTSASTSWKMKPEPVPEPGVPSGVIEIVL